MFVACPDADQMVMGRLSLVCNNTCSLTHSVYGLFVRLPWKVHEAVEFEATILVFKTNAYKNYPKKAKMHIQTKVAYISSIFAPPQKKHFF